MKLVRLTSTENKAMFDNTLNDPISLKAGASVALANLALASEQRSVAIDAGNGIVTWSTFSSDVEVGDDNTLTLDAGVYNAGTEGAFMDNMTGDLNDNQKTENFLDGLGNHGLMMNTQWSVVENTGQPNAPGAPPRLVDDKKIIIGFRKACTSWLGKEPDSDASPLAKDFVSLNTTASTANQYNRVERTAGSGDDLSNLVGHIPMSWGPGGFGLRLHTLSDVGAPAADVQGVFFGLTSINHAVSKPATQPTRAECKFGVHCAYADTSQTYTIYQSGTATASNKIIAAGDSVFIRRDEGILQAYVAADYLDDSWAAIGDGGDDSELSTDWNQKDNASAPLYPVVIFYGAAANTKIEQLSYGPDPYKFYTWRNGENQTSDCLWDPFWGTGGQDEIDFKMQLSPDVATFLGFMSGFLGDFKFPPSNYSTQSRLVSAESFGWKAVRSYADAGISESFYVQLLSVGCEGYDGLKNGRENILAVIPKSDASNQLLYDVANPLFLEIGNAFPISLRNISARVLTEDGGELPTDGLSVMTLLFK